MNDERSLGGVRAFLRRHRAEVDPIRPLLREQPDHLAVMRTDELVQSRSALLDLAALRGYRAGELAQIAEGYNLAQILMDGGYRAFFSRTSGHAYYRSRHNRHATARSDEQGRRVYYDQHGDAVVEGSRYNR